MTVSALRWEFIKENKKSKKVSKKRKNTSSRPRKRSRKNDNGQEKKKENTLSTKKQSRNKASFHFFLVCYRFIFLSWSLSWSRACFLPFSFFSWSLSIVETCFLLSLINSNLWTVNLPSKKLTHLKIFQIFLKSHYLIFLLLFKKLIRTTIHSPQWTLCVVTQQLKVHEIKYL